ncbi:MAG: GNAT family N-acetyltransferase [Clostridia bacterium]|nr:GNAT family N-acetyltransferase [Clostridia bacterium]MBQ6721501.1 GNAT family N-acetyltransferase [Clostridia bacterium]
MKYRILRFLSFPSVPPRSSGYAEYFSRLPVLETPSLILRPMVMKDAEDIYVYSSDPEVARYVLWEPHRSVRDTRMYIRYIRSLYHNGLPSSWAVVLRETGRVIGSVGFMWVSEENSSAEVGYSLSRQYWNRGYATEALSAVLRSAFSVLPLNRIEAQRDLRNPASGRVMEKCGMHQEGTLRSRIYNKGEFIDVVLCAILRSDWENAVLPG